MTDITSVISPGDRRWILIMLMMYVLCFDCRGINAQIDAVLSDVEEEWLMPVLTPVISKLATCDIPILMAVSLPLQKQEIYLLRRVVNGRILFVSTSPEKKTSKDIPGIMVETLVVSPDPMQTGMFMAKKFWGTSDRVVVVSMEDLGAMVQGAALAAHLRVPFLPVNTTQNDKFSLFNDTLKSLGTKHISLVTTNNDKIPLWILSIPKNVQILSRGSLEQAIVSHIKPSEVHNIIVTRISKNAEWIAESAWLAPYLSLMRKAPILFCQTSNAQKVEDQVRQFIATHKIKPRNLTILADHDAIGLIVKRHAQILEQYVVEVEPCSMPDWNNAVSLGVGRIPTRFLRDTSRILARTFTQERLVRKSNTRRLTMISNPTSGFGTFPLAETICRSSAEEFKNFGVLVDEYYQKAADPPGVRESVYNANFIIFQGHVTDQYLFFYLSLDEIGNELNSPEFEPNLTKYQLGNMPVVMLQTCSSLEESVSQIIFDSGGTGFIGSVTKIHSASGSAFMKAFCDGLVYRDDTVGEALRDARNYFLCLAQLRAKLNHKELAKVYRVALSFRLWGDPEVKLFPGMSKPKHRPVNAKFTPQQNIRISTPRNRLGKVQTNEYLMHIFPGSQAAGIVKSHKNKEQRRIMSLYFFRILIPPGFDVQKYRDLRRSSDKSPRTAFLTDAYKKYLYVLYFPKNSPQKGKGEQILLRFYSEVEKQKR